ncbi:MAG: hypothetical protein A3G76_13505 [Acidobacteria bacterium RIFCSPLOWO2_12_FULL_65_11]|nr:MAG: hypothetical protein A3G76_13505 [Acidobacteria bacterium RIFCSPLOWO2_12_FULL_65_11]
MPLESRFARTKLPGNQLLAQLPADVGDRLRPHLRSVRLKRGESIFRAHEPLHTAYFPVTGVISLLTHLTDGKTLELGLVGKDGMAGVALLPGVNTMPFDGTVQVAGTALRLTAEALKQMVREPGPIHELLGRYAYSVFALGVQTAACNNFHSLKKRTARWLLMLHDLAENAEFPLTQNTLALMLGVRRPSVTIAARALQRAGLVDYRHGRMRIRNRRGLEAASCECYRVIRQEQQRLLGY